MRLRIGQCAAVEDRNLEVVEFDNGIIDTQGVECRKQVLDRGNPDSTAHQRCGIGDPFDGAHISLKFEVVEIEPSEDDSLSGRSWKNTHRGSLTRVQADSAELNGGFERLLSHREGVVQFHDLLDDDTR